MGIVCLAGIFAVFLLLAWTLCRAAGWEKEREDLEQEQYLKEWRGKKMKKKEKNLKIMLAFLGVSYMLKSRIIESRYHTYRKIWRQYLRMMNNPFKYCFSCSQRLRTKEATRLPARLPS